MDGSNPIIKDIYTADPSVLVYKGRLYLYTGHDEPPQGKDEYVMKDWRCFSTADMTTWRAHSSPLQATDFKWATRDAYACKVIQKDNRFYWYAPVRHATKGMAIGVATSDKPEGPFVDVKGSALVTLDMLPATENEKANIDPSVIIDDDGQAHMFWGSKTCYQARLKTNMSELEGPIKIVDLPEFSEGASITKHGEWYYLSYGYGMPEKVGYAMSRKIDGPWEFKGIINDVPSNCETNRPAIIDFNGNSYFFYHNGMLDGGGSHRRSVCVDYLYYNDDGTIKPVIMTTTA